MGDGKRPDGDGKPAPQPQSMNEDQVRSLLRYIEETQDETVKAAVFRRLGEDCFRCRGLEEKVRRSAEDVAGFLDRINVQGTSKYWESLLFSEDKTVLTLTGRPVEICACAFAVGGHAPESLCAHCCKVFQEHYFSTLFGEPVEVEITESFLYGSNRCNTLIRFLKRIRAMEAARETQGKG
ncbi:MAG: hypothetical protein KBA30_06925 [Clostridia bacterium]|nr:hypothetical protein [Clostridia bacterium]